MKRLLIPAILLLGACASMDTPSGDAEAVIRKNASAFAAAASSGNVDGMLAFYADDAILLPPNAPMFRGKDAIRQFWSGFASLGAINAQLITDDVLQSGDLAAETGHFDLTITPKGGAPIKDNGKFLVVWKRINGEWRIVRDTFNSSMPR